MTTDEQFIRMTFNLAKKGMGGTNPNPLVGAVIVKNGQVISRGYHKKVGSPHAEIEAITHARRGLVRLKGAILYVNLEPCVNFGKTPPCVDEIIESDIQKVVCSTLDPNPKVHGKGVVILKKAGINVSVGILEREARQLNEAFFTFHKKKRPFIALKFASSLDGKLTSKSGDSRWITNEKARNYAYKLRSQYQAVLIGINTVLKDDPYLGNGLRIILDSSLKIPLKAQVLRDTNVIVAATGKSDKQKLQHLTSMGITVIKFKGKQIPLKELLRALYQREIISVFVEGGTTVLKSFIDEKLFNKVYAFYSPIFLDGANTMEDAIRLKTISFRRFGDNILINGS